MRASPSPVVTPPDTYPQQESLVSATPTTFTRRRFAALIPVALAGTVALTGALGSITGSGASAAPASAPAAQATGLKATVDLNLRAGPGTTYKVLLVIPENGSVVDYAESSNGFRRVAYNGTVGWASELYLAYDEPIPPHAGPIIGVANATVDLNHRATPSLSAQVIQVIPKGGRVQITETTVNGWRYVYFNDLGGWVADQYLAVPTEPEPEPEPPYDPGYATTTADLNLRAGPTSATKVLAIIPAGTRVKLEAGASGDYRQVTYNGIRGWAAYAYLN